MPPASGDRPAEEPEPEPCDGSCSCDPSACEVVTESEGCAGAPGGSLWLLGVLFGISRWRRRASLGAFECFEACKSTQNR